MEEEGPLDGCFWRPMQSFVPHSKQCSFFESCSETLFLAAKRSHFPLAQELLLLMKTISLACPELLYCEHPK